MSNDSQQEQLSAARLEYADCADRFWTSMREHGSDAANLESARADEIAKNWADKGAVMALLLPLLTDARESVRYAAAASLLANHHPEPAIPVLRAVARNPSGLVAPVAKLVLMKNRIPLSG